MSRPIKPIEIRCKDGRMFAVVRLGGGITVLANFRDPAVASSGLGRYITFHEPGDGDAEHTGMPVEIVRAYAKAHGGVAEAGAEALTLLKALPSTAATSESVAPQAVEEAAPPPPFPLLGDRWRPDLPRPRLCPGHWIALSWADRRRLSSPSTS